MALDEKKIIFRKVLPHVTLRLNCIFWYRSFDSYDYIYFANTDSVSHTVEKDLMTIMFECGFYKNELTGGLKCLDSTVLYYLLSVGVMLPLMAVLSAA